MGRGNPFLIRESFLNLPRSMLGWTPKKWSGNPFLIRESFLKPTIIPVINYYLPPWQSLLNKGVVSKAWTSASLASSFVRWQSLLNKGVVSKAVGYPGLGKGLLPWQSLLNKGVVSNT